MRARLLALLASRAPAATLLIRIRVGAVCVSEIDRRLAARSGA